MDLILLEKFIIELSHPTTKPAIRNFFNNLTINPSELFVAGIPRTSYLMGLEPNTSDFVHCMLFGIALTASSRDPEMVKQLTNYLEYKSRERGENIIDFFQARAGKGK